MKIEVGMAQARCVRPGLYVPALISLCITTVTGDVGPNAEIPPEVSTFIDLTPERARDLALELIRHVQMIEDAECENGS